MSVTYNSSPEWISSVYGNLLEFEGPVGRVERGYGKLVGGSLYNSLLDVDPEISVTPALYGTLGSGDTHYDSTAALIPPVSTAYGSLLTSESDKGVPTVPPSVLDESIPPAAVAPPPRREWNEEFQRLLEEVTDSHKSQMRRAEGLKQLTHDFVTHASALARDIIRDIGAEVKKIPLAGLGGQAGGEKYLLEGVFFKLARDFLNIYGSDALAMKAADNELRGLNAVFGSETIPLSATAFRVPLFAIIEYSGWRCVAIAQLPIDKSTLIFGSADGGATFTQGIEPDVERRLDELGAKLKLSPHPVGPKAAMSRFPVDIEVHHGRDGRFYIIDAARIVPPSMPEEGAKMNVIYYNQLRPEYLQLCDMELNSDVFSPFSMKDPNKRNQERKMERAREHMEGTLIPAVAKKLVERYAFWLFDIAGMRLTGLAGHASLACDRVGMNIRDIGRLLVHVKEDTQLLTLLFGEITARVIKNMLRLRLRLCQSDDSMKLLVARFFQCVLGSYPPFWRVVLAGIIVKFKGTDEFFSSSEASAIGSDRIHVLLSLLDRWWITQRLTAMTGVVFVETRDDVVPTKVEFDVLRNKFHDAFDKSIGKTKSEEEAETVTPLKSVKSAPPAIPAVSKRMNARGISRPAGPGMDIEFSAPPAIPAVSLRMNPRGISRPAGPGMDTEFFASEMSDSVTRGEVTVELDETDHTKTGRAGFLSRMAKGAATMARKAATVFAPPIREVIPGARPPDFGVSDYSPPALKSAHSDITRSDAISKSMIEPTKVRASVSDYGTSTPHDGMPLMKSKATKSRIDFNREISPSRDFNTKSKSKASFASYSTVPDSESVKSAPTPIQEALDVTVSKSTKRTAVIVVTEEENELLKKSVSTLETFLSTGATGAVAAISSKKGFARKGEKAALEEEEEAVPALEPVKVGLAREKSISGFQVVTKHLTVVTTNLGDMSLAEARLICDTYPAPLLHKTDALDERLAESLDEFEQAILAQPANYGALIGKGEALAAMACSFRFTGPEVERVMKVAERCFEDALATLTSGAVAAKTHGCKATVRQARVHVWLSSMMLLYKDPDSARLHARKALDLLQPCLDKNAASLASDRSEVMLWIHSADAHFNVASIAALPGLLDATRAADATTSLKERLPARLRQLLALVNKVRESNKSNPTGSRAMLAYRTFQVAWLELLAVRASSLLVGPAWSTAVLDSDTVMKLKEVEADCRKLIDDGLPLAFSSQVTRALGLSLALQWREGSDIAMLEEGLSLLSLCVKDENRRGFSVLPCFVSASAGFISPQLCSLRDEFNLALRQYKAVAPFLSSPSSLDLASLVEEPTTDACIPLHVGNTNTTIDTPDGKRFKWTLFVRPSSDSSRDGGHLLDVIESVTFSLHQSYTPNQITVRHTPFQITRIGWGVFDINIAVRFASPYKHKRLNIVHSLSLPDDSINTIILRGLV